MTFRGSFSLQILNDKLDFDSINIMLKLDPTDIYKKGLKYNKYGTVTENDVWYYTIKFDTNDDPNCVLEKLLKKLSDSKLYLKEIANKYNVSILCMLISDSAEMFINLKPHVVQKIAELNINFDISIFSFGEIKDK